MRVVRDLDDNARLLWIDDSKTESGKRTLAVPEVLAAQLRARAEGKAPGDRLFERSRHWVRDQAKRLCKLAGVPYAPPHGLRGTHSTIGLLRTGQSPEEVARALGHSSPAVTRAHYLDPEQAREDEQRRVEFAVLNGGRR